MVTEEKTKIVVLTALFNFIHAVKNSYISTAITCRKHIISQATIAILANVAQEEAGNSLHIQWMISSTDFGLKDKQVQAKHLFKESEIFCSGSDGSAMQQDVNQRVQTKKLDSLW